MLSLLHWHTAVDFLILAAAFYALLRWARSARALRIVLGIVALHAASLLAQRLDLVITSWVLDAAAVLAILILLLVFQPELRRAFMRLDSALKRWPARHVDVSQGNRALAAGAFQLARAGLGALIVVVRRDSIAEVVEGGVTLNAAITEPLLESIFQKTSPLHDGAVVVEADLLVRAAVILPLSLRQDLPGYYGTRHRAGIGLAERCDALVIVVSEERGQVVLVRGRMAQFIQEPAQLVDLLQELRSRPPAKAPVLLRRLFLANLGLKFAAIGLAAVIWGMTFLASGTTIRTVSVPIQFDNVPMGLEITEQSTGTLQLQIRGSPWIMNSVSLGDQVASFDLSRMGPGWHTLKFAPGTLALPPGLVVDRVTPVLVRVRLARATD
ncbi:MAG TPA: diadenylate cyclase [Bryobacteraceae bacterium]|nr:diadenylate cyclase [Bryobacteraceae bacterium]